MSNKVDFAEEFAENTNMATEVTELPEGAETAPATEKETYTLNDGSQGSRAAFIREKFLQDNMSRKEIADKFGLPYRVVYSATVNMTNSAETPARGRSSSNANIHLTADGHVVIQKDGKVLIDGEETAEVVDFDALEVVNRNEWIKEQVAAGVNRGEIAKKLDMSYGVVYSLTKEMEGTRVRNEITLEDGTVVSRAAYIRMQFAAGKSRGDIAKEMNVPYSVVWQATKTEKTDNDQMAELIDGLKKFVDKVEDPAYFNEIIAALESVKLKEPETTEATEATSEAPAEFAE